jgi:hypothetical protein
MAVTGHLAVSGQPQDGDRGEHRRWGTGSMPPFAGLVATGARPHPLARENGNRTAPTAEGQATEPTRHRPGGDSANRATRVSGRSPRSAPSPLSPSDAARGKHQTPGSLTV